MSYKTSFGLQKEPFCQDIRVEDLYPLPGLQAEVERCHYTLKLGTASIVAIDDYHKHLTLLSRIDALVIFAA